MYISWGSVLYCRACICVLVAAVEEFVLLQPLLHAYVEHRLIGVPVHVFHARDRADDQILTGRQRLQAKNIPQKQLIQKKIQSELISFHLKCHFFYTYEADLSIYKNM